MNNSSPLIHVQNLNTYYGASHILQGVNFSVAAGETVGLMVSAEEYYLAWRGYFKTEAWRAEATG